MIYSTIEELASDNKLWLRYALEISKNVDTADELLSDMYYNLIMIKSNNPLKTFSKSYVYSTLKNHYLKSLQPKKQLKFDRDINLEYIPDEEVEPEVEDNTPYEFYNYTMEYLNDSKTKEDWFHKTIFKYVLIDGMSIRELERRSKIHFNILQSSIQSTRAKLIQNFDYNNEQRKD